jgi:hypothetical protein
VEMGGVMLVMAIVMMGLMVIAIAGWGIHWLRGRLSSRAKDPEGR